MEQTLQAKIDHLISNKIINIGTLPPTKAKHRSYGVLPLDRMRRPLVGDFCRAVVVGKDEEKKELLLHLTYLVDEEQQIYINPLKCKGYIRDFDLIEEYSIFTYVNTFRQTSLATEILAKVSHVHQNRYEMTLKCKQQHQLTPGITRDQVDLTPRDWKIYQKYGCFSATSLAHYEPEFPNPALLSKYCRDLRIRGSDSLNEDSLVHWLGQYLVLSRVRQVQEKQWADAHFTQGLQYLKQSKPQMALEYLTIAKSFAKGSAKIYVARGCALANLNNFQEGLRQIKEALRLSPRNKEALQYHERIKKEMRAKERREEFVPEGEEEISKVRLTNEHQILKKK